MTRDRRCGSTIRERAACAYNKVVAAIFRNEGEMIRSVFREKLAEQAAILQESTAEEAEVTVSAA